MKKRIALVSICSFLGLSGFGSAPHKMNSDQCHAYFGSLDLRTSHTIERLSPWLETKGRSPASAQPLDRESWRKWANTELKEMQLLSDDAKTAGGNAELRRLLTDISNEMVHFQGQTNVGGVEKMKNILTAVRVRIKKGLNKGSCGSL